MFVQLVCPERDQDQINELYEVIAALCHREGVQIEDRGERVEILVCPQGKILVDEVDHTLFLSANTRHAGPGFHAFVVDFFKNIEEELPDGKYELIDDTEYDKDEDFHRLWHAYENELEYLKDKLLHDEDFRQKNYLFEETFYLPEQKEGMVNTNVGRMSKEEFARKELSELMDDFFVWNDWDRDGHFYRNAALNLLAQEGMGPYSAMNDKTEKTANEIADYIEIAHEQDPDLELPLDAYEQIIKLLNRENKLLDARNMDRESTQYRLEDVYHLFEDVRVMAPGTAERNYDPVTQSVNLLAPYKNIEDWSWLIQASKQPAILPDYKEIEETTPTEKDGNKIYMDEFIEDGIYNVDAVILKGDQRLFLHGIARDSKDAALLRDCFENSGFVPYQ